MHKGIAAVGSTDLLKVDAANLVRRNRASTSGRQCWV